MIHLKNSRTLVRQNSMSCVFDRDISEIPLPATRFLAPINNEKRRKCYQIAAILSDGILYHRYRLRHPATGRPGLLLVRAAEELERAKGIEPSYAAWEAAVLPLNYARKPY